MENLDELVGPFTAAMTVTLRELAGTEVIIREAYPTTGAGGFRDVSAILRLAAGGEGFLVLSLPEQTATALARQILDGTGLEADPSMIRDCMGEVANVVAGQAKTLLFGTPYHFTFSTPTVVDGLSGVPDADRWVATFDCDAGEFALHVCLPSRPAGESVTDRGIGP